LIGLADTAIRQGKDPLFILEGLLMRLSELSRAVYGLDSDFDPERKASNHDVAVRIGHQNLLRFRSTLADAHKEMRSITLPRLWLELTLTKLTEQPAPNNISLDPHVAQPAKPENINTLEAEAPRLLNVSLSSGAIEDQWNQTVAQLTSQYKAAGKMLVGTKVVRYEGNLVEVGVPGKFQFERLEENKNDVRGIIIRAFRKTIGDERIEVRFVLHNHDIMSDSPPEDAVQSPVEGESLSHLVEEVFDVQPSKEMESKA
jgi:DNA polymerase III gamma/tau subunit